MFVSLLLFCSLTSGDYVCNSGGDVCYQRYLRNGSVWIYNDILGGNIICSNCSYTYLGISTGDNNQQIKCIGSYSCPNSIFELFHDKTAKTSLLCTGDHSCSDSIVNVSNIFFDVTMNCTSNNACNRMEISIENTYNDSVFHMICSRDFTCSNVQLVSLGNSTINIECDKDGCAFMTIDNYGSSVINISCLHNNSCHGLNVNNYMGAVNIFCHGDSSESACHSLDFVCDGSNAICNLVCDGSNDNCAFQTIHCKEYSTCNAINIDNANPGGSIVICEFGSICNCQNYECKNTTQSPSKYPTITPTKQPSLNPSIVPTFSPSINPTVTTLYPTKKPIVSPSKSPSITPSVIPTSSPLKKDDPDSLLSNTLYLIGGASLVLLIICICGICFWCRHRKKSKKAKELFKHTVDFTPVKIPSKGTQMVFTSSNFDVNDYNNN